MGVPIMYTPKEVAGIIRSTPLRVREFLREGRLPGVRCGRRWLIPEDKLQEWIASGGQPLPGGWRREA